MSIKVQAVDVFYKDAGQGEPVLFLHGNPDSADIWSEVIAGMQKDFRCIAIDLPGFGRSEAPKNFDCPIENLGKFIEEFLVSLGIKEPINLVAHDFGGAFAMAYAIAYPAKVRRIVSINHPFFVSSYKWHTFARIWRVPLLGEYSMLTTTWPAFRSGLKNGSNGLTDDQLRKTYAMFTAGAKRMVLKLYRAVGPDEFKQWEPAMLKAVAQIPSLALWGEKDPWIPRWVAEKLGARRVIRFQEAGHAVPAEIPDKVSKELLSFFVL